MKVWKYPLPNERFGKSVSAHEGNFAIGADIRHPAMVLALVLGGGGKPEDEMHNDGFVAGNAVPERPDSRQWRSKILENSAFWRQKGNPETEGGSRRDAAGRWFSPVPRQLRSNVVPSRPLGPDLLLCPVKRKAHLGKGNVGMRLEEG